MCWIGVSECPIHLLPRSHSNRYICLPLVYADIELVPILYSLSMEVHNLCVIVDACIFLAFFFGFLLYITIPIVTLGS